MNSCLTASFLLVLGTSCARVDFYYPSDGKDYLEPDGRSRPQRALVLNGVDSLGSTHVRVTKSGVEFSSEGGLDSSTTTLGWQRTIRYGIAAAASAAATVGVANVANSAYQATNPGAPAPAPAPAPLPAAGSTIPAQIPAVVTPVP